MQHITISNKSAATYSKELNVSVATYFPVSRSLRLSFNDSESFDSVSSNDELLMVEYSGFSSNIGAPEYFCREVAGDTIMDQRYTDVDADDTIIGIYSGTAISKAPNQYATFSVTEDLSSVLTDNGGKKTAPTTLVNEDVVSESGDRRKYHYVRYFIRRRYYSVQVGLSMVNDYVGMNNESNVEAIVAEAKESLIPPIIDMEKIKFSPVYANSTENGIVYEKVNRIVMRFNFLHRDAWGTLSGSNNSARTNSFAIDNKGWYTDCYSGKTSTKVVASAIDGKATLLGYIGFADGDVRYQKNKLAKSFARISYYSTNDPISNTLLNYSTVFMDTGELFGKYVKIEKNGEYIKGFFEDQQISQYIHTMASGETRLDCTVYMTDEYDEKKSGEGFNIYLFSDDYKNVSESEPSTIYMKVEFNHAGYGKVMQMMRPVEAEVEFGNNEKKVVSDYISYAFIPLTVFYESTSGKFVYTFPDGAIAYEDGTVYIDLYEATITKQEEGPNLC